MNKYQEFEGSRWEIRTNAGEYTGIPYVNAEGVTMFIEGRYKIERGRYSPNNGPSKRLVLVKKEHLEQVLNLIELLEGT